MSAGGAFSLCDAFGAGVFSPRDGGQHVDLLPGPRDEHVQAPFPAGTRERAKISPEFPLLIRAKSRRDDDVIPLVALDVFQVFYEKAFEGIHPASFARHR